METGYENGTITVSGWETAYGLFLKCEKALVVHSGIVAAMAFGHERSGCEIIMPSDPHGRCYGFDWLKVADAANRYGLTIAVVCRDVLIVNESSV